MMAYFNTLYSEKRMDGHLSYGLQTEMNPAASLL